MQAELVHLQTHILEQSMDLIVSVCMHTIQDTECLRKFFQDRGKSLIQYEIFFVEVAQFPKGASTI